MLGIYIGTYITLLFVAVACSRFFNQNSIELRKYSFRSAALCLSEIALVRSCGVLLFKWLNLSEAPKVLELSDHRVRIVMELLLEIEETVRKDEVEVARKDEVEMARKEEVEMARKDEVEIPRKDEVEMASKSEVEMARKDEVEMTRTRFPTREETLLIAETEEPVIGIDLGTTYSRVVVFRRDQGTFKDIANDHGKNSTAAYVLFTDGGKLIGDLVKDHVELIDPTKTVFNAKRLIGRRFDDQCVQSDIRLSPFEVISRGNKLVINVAYKGKSKQFSAEKISSMVMKKMNKIAEKQLDGQAVKNAVISVPAYFNDAQRRATLEVAALSGLHVLRLINEPTAAAIAYGVVMKKQFGASKELTTILVFDLGGGTFDASLVTVAESSVYDVLAVAGDTHLGGEDFTNRLVDDLINEFKLKHKKDITGNARALQRLRAAAERAKTVLSTNERTTIYLKSLHEGTDFISKVTRARFEELNVDLFCKCIYLVERCLMDANVDKRQVNDVLLLGGSSRIPLVEALLQNFFNKSRPFRKFKIGSAIAYGAAVQGAALLGGVDVEEVKGFSLQDVTPHTLGVEMEGGSMTTLIPRNSKIPMKSEWPVTTTDDNQPGFQFAVYAGEGERARDNIQLQNFKVAGILPAPRITLCFLINCDGVLNVSAEDKSPGASNKITVTIDTGTEEVEEVEVRDGTKRKRILNEEEEARHGAKKKRIMNEEEEVVLRTKLEARTAIQFYVYNTMNTVKEVQHVSKDVKRQMRRVLNWATSWMFDNVNADVNELEGKKRELESLCDSIYFHVHKEEGEKSRDNNELEKLEAAGVPRAPESVPQIDASEGSAVSAEDKTPGASNTITVTNISTGNAEVTEEVRDGAQEEEEEVMRKLEAKNAITDYVFNTKQALKDKKTRSLLRIGQWKKMKTALNGAMTWLVVNSTGEVDELEGKKRELEDFCNPIILRALLQLAKKKK